MIEYCLKPFESCVRGSAVNKYFVKPWIGSSDWVGRSECSDGSEVGLGWVERKFVDTWRKTHVIGVDNAKF
jgi:hypothetical protein